MSTNPSPSKYCDIVMKGGITSGVVYPAAVVELSKTYSFKNIGGTSAGAIAAVVTAAAEYGRQHGTGGFDEVESLPHALGAVAPNSPHSRLFSLFQPQAETRPLFRLLTAAIGNKPYQIRPRPIHSNLFVLGSRADWCTARIVAGLSGLAIDKWFCASVECRLRIDSFSSRRLPDGLVGCCC